MVKATASIRKSVSPSSAVLEGKVRKQTTGDEQVEIQMYLSKLRQLVPNMPKNRKVSKVEVINNVIDYICDLQTALLDQLHQNPSNNNNNVVVANSCAQPIIMDTSPADCPTCWIRKKRKTVIATTSGRTITCDNYLKNRRPLYIILLSLHTYYLPTCLSRNTKKKHGKFLPVSYHHTNKHSSFLFSNGLDAFCVSSLASGVARVFLMAHTHTVIIKIALTMGRDGDRRIWCRCSMMKKKKSARELYEHKWFTRY